MGYSHGTKWNLERIKKELMEIVERENLDRMPSRSEIVRFGNNALACAISRHIGWYELARRVGLPVKKSDTYVGKRFEEKAKNDLERMGFKVEQMSQNFPYDLLLNSGVKIDVKASKLFKGKNGNFYAFNLEKKYCTCDIYLLYLLDDADNEKDVLVIPSIFVYNNTQISIGETSSKYYKFSKRWDYLAKYVGFIIGLAQSTKSASQAAG